MKLLVAGFTVLLAFTTAYADDMVVKIAKDTSKKVPVSIVPFAGQSPVDMAAVVRNDLNRSGLFDLIASPVAGGNRQQVLAALRSTQANFALTGQVQNNPGGYQVTYDLSAVASGQNIQDYQLTMPRDYLRQAAHTISNMVYEQLLGHKGIFTTRLAYITVSHRPQGQRSFDLVVADVDGHNPRVIVSSAKPLLSPVWSPTGDQLAYVSLEQGQAQVMVQNLATGRRQVVSRFAGLNSSPSWSPNGQQLAMTLSKDGNPEIYILNLTNRQLRRVTFNNAIDTEPNWHPDGQSLVFTSNRDGNPQIYRISLAGRAAPQRLTFNGEYNADASYSPDGKRLVMINRSQGRFRVVEMTLSNRRERVLSDGPLDESVAYAPNGRWIVYGFTDQNRQSLAVVALDSMKRQRLDLPGGDIREPAWSPFGQ